MFIVRIILIRFANVMVKKGIFYILFSLIFLQYIRSQNYWTFQYDTSALNKDLKILKNAILRNHPSVGFYGDYNFFYEYFDTSLQVKHPMTEKEFRKLIKSKLNILHCGHTNILPSSKYMKYLKKKKMKLIPYFITYDNEHLVVVKGFENIDTLLKTGDSILQIDNKNADVWIKEIEQYLYTDGFSNNARKEMIQRHFTFYFSGIAEKDSFLIKIKNKNGIYERYIHTREYLRMRNELMQMKSDTLFNHQKQKYFTGFFLNREKNIFYIKIKSFSGIWMKHQFRKAFKQMKKYQTEYLILDLRNNPGGKITQSLSLLSYLLPKEDSLFYQKVIYNIEERKHIRRKLEYRIIDFFLRWRSRKAFNSNIYAEKILVKKRNHFDGKVYVLINANTFSAANLVNVYLNKRPNTIIVGSESAGVKWGSNAVSFLRLKLPHTGIKVIIPTYRIIHNVQYNQTDMLLPIQPHIKINYHLNDLLLKKDKELEAVYHHILKNIKK